MPLFCVREENESAAEYVCQELKNIQDIVYVCSVTVFICYPPEEPIRRISERLLDLLPVRLKCAYFVRFRPFNERYS